MFYKSFWRVLQSKALEQPVEPDLAPTPKPFRPSPEPSLKHCWTWLRSAPKPPGTFSRTFSKTLVNLTWLCTKASQTFSRTFSEPCWTWPGPAPNPGPSPEPCWTWPGPAPKPPRPSPEPSPEPCWTWPGSAPKPPRPSPEPSPELALRQKPPRPSLLRNLPPNPVEPDLAVHQRLPDLYKTF